MVGVLQSSSFLFTNTDSHTRTSATNAARIYNSCLSKHDPLVHPIASFSSESESDPKIELPSLRPEHVWDGFTILSLLEDLESRAPKALLCVPHGGNQKSRFDEAVAGRNVFMSQSGQPEWAHYCSKCCRVWEGENGEPPSLSIPLN